MKVLHGVSCQADAELAVAEATRDWETPEPPEVVLVFVSTKQDPDAVAASLGARFPSSIVLGCTTSGEHLNGSHYRGAVVMTAIFDSGIRWSTTLLEGLDGVTAERAEGVAGALFDAIGANGDADFDPQDYFCLSFIDGLRGCEEHVSALIAEALDGVRLVGGSAGDDLAFRETKVIFGGRALTDGLVVLMGHAKGRVQIFKQQHFERSATRLAITKVDSAQRRVIEIDGMPALVCYARALGLAPADVTDAVTFLNPITLSCNGETFIRSIRQVNADGSLSFYCGVEEGMVVELGVHQSLVGTLNRDLATQTERGGMFDLMIGCNCILRALEADRSGIVEPVGDAWKRAARISIGFDTYGEQLDGLHINQTLLAIGIREAA